MTNLTKADCEGITPRHISNLRIHADYVEALPEIDMWMFAADNYGHWQDYEGINDCGTPMCAIGHVPHNPDLHVNLEKAKCWSHVGLEAFGICHSKGPAFTLLFIETFGDDVPSNPLIVANGMRKAADMLEAAIGGSE